MRKEIWLILSTFDFIVGSVVFQIPHRPNAKLTIRFLLISWNMKWNIICSGWASTVALPWGWWRGTTSPTTASCLTPATWQGMKLQYFFEINNCHAGWWRRWEKGWGSTSAPSQRSCLTWLLSNQSSSLIHQPLPSQEYQLPIYLFCHKVGGFRCDYRGALDLGVTCSLYQITFSTQLYIKLLSVDFNKIM